MQVFEYYFNPKAQKDRFFEVFSLEPQKDPSLGNFYIVGELSHTLPQNSGLLQKLAKLISQEYSLSLDVKSQDAFFHALLQKTNGFFAQELRKGNVDWLGNLHIVFLHIKNSGKKSSVMFSKTGGSKVFMARGTNVVDLGKNLQGSSHGAELFGNAVSLQAFAQDKLIVLTKDIADALVRGNILSDISALSGAKQFQLFFKKHNKIFSRLSGILFAVLAEELIAHTPPLSFLKKSMFSLKLPKLRVSLSQLFRFPVSKIQTSFPALKDPIRQKIAMLAVFGALLAGGFLAFQGEKKELQREAQTVMLQIQVIQKEAESALELHDARSANILLQEAWKKASLRTGKEVPFRETFSALQEKLEQQLLAINNIHSVKDPAVLLDIKKQNTNLIPQSMILAQRSLYFFNPFSPAIFIFDLENETGKTFSASKAIRNGISLAGSALLLEEPNTLLRVEQDGRMEPFLLSSLSFLGGMAGFDKNIYILNSQQGSITKYEDPLSNAAAPSAWMREESLKKPAKAKSMAIDGNVWILTADNILERYFGGLWQEDMKPLVFPLIENAAMVKVFPGIPYLYILDPAESRIILLTKFGDLVKQYMVEIQDPLLDFTVSKNGNTLYLLAGSKVFAIEAE